MQGVCDDETQVLLVNKLLDLRILTVLTLLAGLAACADNGAATKTAGKPNVIIMYIDDLGYGDVGSYGAVGIDTPNIDHLAANGIRFTDAHSSAATCQEAAIRSNWSTQSLAPLPPGNTNSLQAPLHCSSAGPS